MAEVLGVVASGVTLAALFKTCIEAFSLIQTCQQQDSDFKKLKIRLNIERCRLYIWGEAMGLTDMSKADEDRPIDKVRFPDMIRDILEAITDLFYDSQQIKEKYGCKEALPDDLVEVDQDSPIRKLAASFSNFSIRPSHNSRAPTIIQKLTWVISDRKKFGALVSEIKDLLDSLQGVTSPNASIDRQKGKMKQKIVKIHDAETLSAIAEVCSEDHPDVADMASTRAESMSLPSTLRGQILAWMEDSQESSGGSGGEGERTLFDLESLTLSEAKQKLAELMRERSRHDKLSTPAPKHVTAPRGAMNSSTLPDISITNLELDSTRGRFADSTRTKPDFHTRSRFPESLKPLPLAAASPHPPPTVRNAAPDFDEWIPRRSSFQPAPPPTLYSAISDQRSSGDWYRRDSFAPERWHVQRKRYSVPTASSLSSKSADSRRTPTHPVGRAFAHVTFYDNSIFTVKEEHALHDLDAAMQIFNTAPHRHWRTHDCKVCSECFLWPDRSWLVSCGHFSEWPFACVVDGCDRHFPALSNLRPPGEVYWPTYSTSSASGKNTFPW